MAKSRAERQISDAAAYLKAFPARIGKGDRTKLRIIDEAIACISAEGLSALNFESLAGRLGVFRSQVTYHFPQLPDLLLAALLVISNVSQALLVEELGRARTPAARLGALISATFVWARKHPEQVRARIACQEAFMTSPALRAFHSEVTETARERIAAVLAAMPAVRPRDREPLAQAIHALIFSALVHHFTTDAEGGIDAVEQGVLRACKSLIPQD